MKIRSPHRGFTLIELVTVIAVIAVLAALALPMLSRAKESSNQVKCVSNLKQVGAAIQSYVNDNNGTLPGPVYSTQTVYYRIYTSDGAIGTYIGSYLGLSTPAAGSYQMVPALICPSWKTQVDSSYIPTPTVGGAKPTNQQAQARPYIASNYIRQSNLSSPFGYSSNGALPLKLVSIPLPATSPAIWDYDGGGTASGSSAGVPNSPVHRGRRNYLYFDWHVEASTPLAYP